jgi:hypothetical protein
MRIAVAREKILQAHQIRVQCGPDQNRAAGAILDQGDPAQDERPHDPLAEFGFCDDDAAQMLGGNEKGFNVDLCARIDERRPAGQLSDFGKELAWSLFDDRHHMAQTIPRADGNGTYDEHEHAGAPFPCHKQEIARFEAPNLAELAETLDLLQPEFWEHLIAALF